jgi:hypothetical protein
MTGAAPAGRDEYCGLIQEPANPPVALSLAVAVPAGGKVNKKLLISMR